MSRVLPPTPGAEHLRKEAKALLKAHHRRDPSCADVLRRLHHLRTTSDEQILATDLSLAAAQFALAMEYGFRTWPELLAEVGARLGSDATNEETDDALPDGERFDAVGTVRAGDDRLWLSPIPRYPLAVRRVDDSGTLQRYERDPASTGRLSGNLYCAMRMRGGKVSWPEVACASAEAFRFAFEPRWAQDAEFITPVDQFAQACAALGFSCHAAENADCSAALEIIDEALAASRPAIVNGWGGRFGHVVVGRDAEAYRVIGGVSFPDSGLPFVEAVELSIGQRPAGHLDIDDCPTRPIPDDDWHGAMLTAQQVSRNPVFVVDLWREVPEGQRIRHTLQGALAMNEPRTIARTNLPYRAKAMQAGPPGHDGWKFTFSPWEGEFAMGSAGLRAWADHVADMAEPTVDFEMVHGVDTTFGGMLAARSRDVVAWLRWAEPRVAAPARAHLERARSGFTELARTNNEYLGLVRTVPCYIEAPLPERTRADLETMLDTQPALLYMITGEERELLGEHAEGSQGSPWGYRLLPGRAMFEAARELVQGRLRHLAEVRDEAFAALGAALAAM